MVNTKKYLLFSMIALLPCITWGLFTFISKISLCSKLDYFLPLRPYFIHRIGYLINAITFLPLLMIIYKKLFPYSLEAYQKTYIQCSILSVVCLLIGLFIKTKFWNYILDGGLVSPLIEEIIARFVLYEARSKGLKIYALVAITSSLSFALMHFLYEPSTLLNKSAILPKLNIHAMFGLMLCGIFWFFPNLKILIIIHSLSNLFYTLTHTSKLGL